MACGRFWFLRFISGRGQLYEACVLATEAEPPEESREMRRQMNRRS
jgi:hypothetical protein